MAVELGSDPLWRELNLAIMDNGGDATGLLVEMLRRRSYGNTEDRPLPPMPPGWRAPSGADVAAPDATGPP